MIGVENYIGDREMSDHEHLGFDSKSGEQRIVNEDD